MHVRKSMEASCYRRCMIPIATQPSSNNMQLVLCSVAGKVKNMLICKMMGAS